MARHADVLLQRHEGILAADLVAFGDPDLRLDDVDAGDLLGDRVFDLDARIDLDEIELAAVGIHQELDGAGMRVVGGMRQPQRSLAQRGAGGLVQIRGRRTLDHLLVAALHRAVALEQMHQIAMTVAEHLDLDMARAAHQLLQIDLVVAEGGLCLAAGHIQRGGEFVLVFDHPHAATATAPAGLQHQRVADLGREFLAAGQVLWQCAGRRHHRHPGLLGQLAGRDLVAQPAHHLAVRADEGDPGGCAGIGEIGVLGQEAIARVNRIDARLLRDADDVVDVEIGLDRFLAGADQIGFVRLEAVQREAILVGKDRDGADPQFGGGAQHTDGDFTTVGNQQAAYGLHRGCSLIKTKGVPNSSLAGGEGCRLIVIRP